MFLVEEKKKSDSRRPDKSLIFKSIKIFEKDLIQLLNIQQERITYYSECIDDHVIIRCVQCCQVSDKKKQENSQGNK
jgi:hypothetical protein